MPGAVSLGDRTVKSLVNAIRESEVLQQTSGKWTVQQIADEILARIRDHYDREYKTDYDKPILELILAGYDSEGSQPKILRIKFPENNIEPALTLAIQERIKR